MVVTDQREQLVSDPPDQAPDPWEPPQPVEPMVLLLVFAALLVLCLVTAGALLVTAA
jgi:hypothetical protein